MTPGSRPSKEGQHRRRRNESPEPGDASGAPREEARPSAADRPGADPPLIGSGAAEGLTQEQRALLEQLRTRDREVRAHEAAHQAAGGGLAGGATFSYQTGPDGRSYAVGGEVPIDLSAGRTPEETIARARQIRAAALAPADPSGQDLRVAGEAAALEMRAMLELLQARQAPGQPTLLPDHLHAGEPCLSCEKNAASYAAPAPAVAPAAEPP